MLDTYDTGKKQKNISILQTNPYQSILQNDQHPKCRSCAFKSVARKILTASDTAIQ